jgi:hypothetical protein
MDFLTLYGLPIRPYSSPYTIMSPLVFIRLRKIVIHLLWGGHSCTVKNALAWVGDSIRSNHHRRLEHITLTGLSGDLIHSVYSTVGDQKTLLYRKHPTEPVPFVSGDVETKVSLSNFVTNALMCGIMVDFDERKELYCFKNGNVTITVERQTWCPLLDWIKGVGLYGLSTNKVKRRRQQRKARIENEMGYLGWMPECDKCKLVFGSLASLEDHRREAAEDSESDLWTSCHNIASRISYVEGWMAERSGW